MSTQASCRLNCPSCGEPLAVASDFCQSPYCARCRSQPNVAGTQRLAVDVFKDVWTNLKCVHTWSQVVGYVILLGTTFMPVMVLWGANRIRTDEPLRPLGVALSVVGGIVGMPLLYPKKGYWLPGVLAGPFFGPGVFLSFGLVAGDAMNKLIFLGLLILGGGPSYALYVFLLYRTERQREESR
jgi:hypothetical protein